MQRVGALSSQNTVIRMQYKAEATLTQHLKLSPHAVLSHSMESSNLQAKYPMCGIANSFQIFLHSGIVMKISECLSVKPSYDRCAPEEIPFVLSR